MKITRLALHVKYPRLSQHQYPVAVLLYIVSHVKSLRAQQGRTKFYKYRRLAFYMI